MIFEAARDNTPVRSETRDYVKARYPHTSFDRLLMMARLLYRGDKQKVPIVLWLCRRFTETTKLVRDA